MPDVSIKSEQLSQQFKQVFLSSSAERGCCQEQGITSTPNQKTSQNRRNHNLKLC